MRSLGLQISEIWVSTLFQILTSYLILDSLAIFSSKEYNYMRNLMHAELLALLMSFWDLKPWKHLGSFPSSLIFKHQHIPVAAVSESIKNPNNFSMSTGLKPCHPPATLWKVPKGLLCSYHHKSWLAISCRYTTMNSGVTCSPNPMTLHSTPF